MGTLAGVPIEPPGSRTDETARCVRETGGRYRGWRSRRLVSSSFLLAHKHKAGGYDAVWVFVFDPQGQKKPGPAERIDALWRGYEELDVSLSSASESRGKELRLEELDGVKGLREVVG
ncbi:phosphomevalonate kinase [Marasmius crinis-equi]|uniref:Phosphomevalonate kinase n=1 Tax=Marasmius crinis-equi TaxID=585013 RepID=A0ABR3FFV6_9AGAR